MVKRALLIRAVDQLLLAFAQGEYRLHIQWEDIELAFDYARQALPGRYEEFLALLAQGDQHAKENNQDPGGSH
jgi:hypothetical protein